MLGILAHMDETERLEKLEIKLGSARLKKVKHCLKCGFCCNRRPCIPTPDELIEIANFLKLDVKTCINKYFAIDIDVKENIYFLKPVGINTKDLAGKFIPSDRTYNEGDCIFLDKNRECKIHKVRPKSAKECNCWEEKETKYNPTIFWKNNQLLKRFCIKEDGGKL